MKDMRLTPHFYLSEFTASEVAARNGIAVVADEAVTANLRRLCRDCLEPLRVRMGVLVVIHSGYRPPAVNGLVGGAKNSAHLYGLAADITVPGVPIDRVAAWLLASDLPFDRMILEFDQWIHIQITPNPAEKPRREVLTAVRVKSWGRFVTQYQRGLVDVEDLA